MQLKQFNLSHLEEDETEHLQVKKIIRVAEPPGNMFHALENVLVQLCISHFICTKATQHHIRIPISETQKTLYDLSYFFEGQTLAGKAKNSEIYIISNKRMGFDALVKIALGNIRFHPLLRQSIDNYYIEYPWPSIPTYSCVIEGKCDHLKCARDGLIELYEKYNTPIYLDFPAFFTEQDILSNRTIKSFTQSGFDVYFAGKIEDGVFSSYTGAIRKAGCRK